MQPMFADGENVHTYVLDDDTLRFAFVSTTEGESDGVPGEAWQRLVLRQRGLHARDVKAAGPRSQRFRAWAAPAGAARRPCRHRTPSPTPLPSRRTVSSSGLPDPPARWPLNSTPVPSGSQAGSAAIAADVDERT